MEHWDQAIYELKNSVFYAGSTELPTVQNAIDAAHSAGGGIVQAPAGATSITATLTMYSNVWLRGCGVGSTTLQLAASSNVNMIGGASGLSDVWITDLTLDATSNTAGYGVSLTSPTRLRIMRARIQNTANNLINLLTAPVDCKVIDCVGSGAGSASFESFYSDAGTDFEGCRVTMGTTGTYAIKVGADSGAYRCYITSAAGSSYAPGAILLSGSNSAAIGNRIAWTNSTKGTLIASNKAAMNVRVEDNRVSGGKAGIHIGGSGGSGITASRCVVAGNILDGQIDDGILFGTDSTADTGTDNLATGNAVYNVQPNLSDPASKGVGIESQLLRTTITGNTVSGCGGHGIYSSGAYNVVSGNICFGNAQALSGYVGGIKLVGTHPVAIGNTSYNNGKSGTNIGIGILLSADITDINEAVLIGNSTTDTATSGSKNQVWGINLAEPSAFRIVHWLNLGNNVLGNFNGSGDTGNLNINTLSGPNWALSNPGQDEQFSRVTTGTVAWDPPSLADGATASTTVTATALMGDSAISAFSLAIPAGAMLTASVTATNTVTVTLQNKTGGVLDLASGTLRVTVLAFR
jgi:parallel beta-helix repeat protein